MTKPTWSKFQRKFGVFCSETQNLQKKLHVLESLRTLSLWWLQNFEKLAYFKYSYKLGGQTLEICNFFPIEHLGFLGDQLKWVTLYVLRAAYCDLAMFFCSSSFFLWHIFPYRNISVNSFSLPCHISISGL